MGMMLNIMLLLSVWSISLMLFGVSTPFNDLATGKTNLQDSIASVISLGNLGQLAAIAAIAGAAALIGAGNAALPYVLFAPVAISIVSFFVFPNVVFDSASTPVELQALAQGLKLIVTIALMISVVTWFKQGGD